jgi:YidC/Oxa1 family membrane protein insertase
LLTLAWPAAATAEAQVETTQLQLRFGDDGHLRQLRACVPDCRNPAAKTLRLVPDQGLVSFEPGLLASWTVMRKRTHNATVLQFEDSRSGARRTWTVPDSGWRLGLEISSPSPIVFASDAAFTHNDADGFARLLGRTRYVTLDAGGVQTTETDETPAATPADARWKGFRNRYWAVLAKPAGSATAIFRGNPSGAAGFTLDSLDQQPGLYALYLGPVEPKALVGAAPELRRLMYSGLWQPLRWICFALFYLLQAIHQWVPHWAASIMLLSITVSVLMWPLSRIADRLQRDVQATEARLAPKIAHIKAQFRGEKQADLMLAMYRAEGVHPLYSLKSLAGIAIVIPIFIGAFDMLAENIWLQGERFAWIADLARPDSVAALPFSLPFLGDRLNLLPVLMTGLSVCASWLHQVTAGGAGAASLHLKRLFLLAVVFLLLFYTFPAGMVLYWTTNNAVAVIKNLRRPGKPLAKSDWESNA